MRSVLYLGAGMLLGAGAPIGLLAMRAFLSWNASIEWAIDEFSAEFALYAYVATGSVIAFGLFGYLLGTDADRLDALAQTDPLTGLLNRRAFEERLRAEMERARRYGTSLALLVIDIDGFKKINDRHGHPAGDRALESLARALRAGSRGTDVAGRWGGDEFVWLAPETRCGEALELAERFRVAVGAAGTELSVSIGVALGHRGLDDARVLEEAADAAMYEAKRAGGNRVVLAG
jgi:diguanylate cyclase (GGDEF)-like protein